MPFLFPGWNFESKKKRILTKSDTICSSKRRLLPESWQILISISPQNCRKKKIPRKSPKKDTGKVPVSVIQIKALLNLTGECHHIYIYIYKYMYFKNIIYIPRTGLTHRNRSGTSFKTDTGLSQKYGPFGDPTFGKFLKHMKKLNKLPYGLQRNTT